MCDQDRHRTQIKGDQPEIVLVWSHYAISKDILGNRIFLTHVGGGYFVWSHSATSTAFLSLQCTRFLTQSWTHRHKVPGFNLSCHTLRHQDSCLRVEYICLDGLWDSWIKVSWIARVRYRGYRFSGVKIPLSKLEKGKIVDFAPQLCLAMEKNSQGNFWIFLSWCVCNFSLFVYTLRRLSLKNAKRGATFFSESLRICRA